MIVGQGPIALAVGAGGGCLDIFTLLYPFSPLSSSLWETARYRMKYCLKGPLNPKQPTNQPTILETCGSHQYCVREWSGGAMVLGKHPVLGHPTIRIIVGQGPIALAIGTGGVFFWTLVLYSILSLFLPLSGRRPDID